MTKHQKEVERKKMMWAALYGILSVMFGILILVAYDKDVKDISMIAGTFFTALAGLNASSFFSRPSGSDDV